MAAAASSSNSQSINQHPVVVPEQPQDASSEICGNKEVKTETTLDSKETEPMKGYMEVKREPQDDLEPIDFMDSKEHIEKFKRYEADFRQYLMSKYFSDKTISGGNIFDVKMNIDGHTITASRLPPYQSFLDPATFLELISKELGPSSAETPSTSTSNGKHSN